MSKITVTEGWIGANKPGSSGGWGQRVFLLTTINVREEEGTAYFVEICRIRARGHAP